MYKQHGQYKCNSNIKHYTALFSFATEVLSIAECCRSVPVSFL